MSKVKEALTKIQEAERLSKKNKRVHVGITGKEFKLWWESLNR